MGNATNKDFNIEKAELLCYTYIENRQAAKAAFLAELISYQYFFGPTYSIVDCKLYLNNLYKRKTAESVLSELGYKIVSFHSQTDYEYRGTRQTNLFCNYFYNCWEFITLSSFI